MICFACREGETLPSPGAGGFGIRVSDSSASREREWNPALPSRLHARRRPRTLGDARTTHCLSARHGSGAARGIDPCATRVRTARYARAFTCVCVARALPRLRDRDRPEEILTEDFETGFLGGQVWSGMDGLRDFLSQRDGFFDEKHTIDELLERTETDGQIEAHTRLHFFLRSWRVAAQLVERFADLNDNPERLVAGRHGPVSPVVVRESDVGHRARRPLSPQPRGGGIELTQRHQWASSTFDGAVFRDLWGYDQGRTEQVPLLR
jgi:hypothetical protein